MDNVTSHTASTIVEINIHFWHKWELVFIEFVKQHAEGGKGFEKVNS